MALPAVAALLKANPLPMPSTLKVGTVIMELLLIPSANVRDWPVKLNV
jgi:hypothetical protein